jgi:tRNA (guanine10-N2)-dimethyltransferase
VAAPRAVLLSGEHPTLPAAELRALLAVHDPGARVEVNGLVAVVHPHTPEGTDAALARMALAHEWGDWWGDAAETDAGLATLAKTVAGKASGSGSAAVATERRGAGKAVDRVQVERGLGAALQSAGHRIDLKTPDHVVFAWLVDGRITVGLRRGLIDRGAYDARCAFDRAHFSPVTLHPRRAASLLHLAQVQPGGRVYDPFCGTGGLVLEAAVEGYDAWGSDLDAFMVQGTMTTLADAALEPLAGTVFEADVGDTPRLVGTVDAIVTDFPYGRASGSEGEDLRRLYGRALDAFAQMLPRGGRAVIGHADPDLLGDIESHGLRLVERHAEPVHKSLTRHYAVVIRP